MHDWKSMHDWIQKTLKQCEVEWNNFMQATGKTVRFTDVTDEEMRSLHPSAAFGAANLWQYWRDMPYASYVRDASKAFFQGQSFREWVGQHSSGVVKHLEACI